MVVNRIFSATFRSSLVDENAFPLPCAEVTAATKNAPPLSRRCCAFKIQDHGLSIKVFNPDVDSQW